MSDLAIIKHINLRLPIYVKKQNENVTLYDKWHDVLSKVQSTQI